MRTIDRIIWHCSATPEGRDVGVDTIRDWHVNDNGWRDIGYHYVIELDGTLRRGRPESEIGAHVKGHNGDSIGICYVGGMTADEAQPKDTRTPAQKAALYALTDELLERHPGATVHGHDEYAAKACPSFDAKADWEARLREREAEAVAAGRRSFARYGPPNEVGGYGDMACHAVPPGAACWVEAPPLTTTRLPFRPSLTPDPGPACWLPAEEDR
ncbi:MAG: N-acetylmuramoyl-L-alanine amidase [Paracoccaceae bacterium]